MENPFKFGSLVDAPYFTDRVKELDYIVQFLKSENHLVLMSPRRFGKSSLVKKAVIQTQRPYLWLNMQAVLSKEDFAAKLLKELLNQFKLEKMMHYLRNFRIIPSINMNPMTDEILTFTSCHPYYTQQLSFAVWNNLVAGKNEDVLQLAVEDIITTHDLDYERLWLNFNKTDKYVMVSICEGNNPAQDRNQPTSTMTRALLRLSKKGYIIRSDRYEIEDPFFRKWILKNMIE